ncbi:uncharacterized protein LOC143056610 isoform X2 [Mytilus galloprovincialis]|uniref:uncharacterized protein LOC143056610 isoform X2 n=1 Tax=Mytilus galloprovincialis TaxID=29158 RepID=UPI003F7C8970
MYKEDKRYPFPDLKKRLDGGKTYISHRKDRDPVSKLSHGIRRLENRIYRYDVEQRRLMDEEFENQDFVRKKLQFTDDEDETGLDFTDKIAALRSILKRPQGQNDYQNDEINGDADFVSPRLLGVDAKNSKKKRSLQERQEEGNVTKKQVDEELAKMSYQNYEAMQHLEKYSGLLTSVGNKINRKKDPSPKTKLVQDNMEFVLNGKDNQKLTSNGLDSKFKDLDQVPERDKATTCIYIHNYESSPKCQNCHSNLLCRNCPDHSRCHNCIQNSSYSSRQGNLTCPKCYAPLLENGASFDNPLSSSQRSSKFIQSNVPHFDPLWDGTSYDGENHRGKHLSKEKKRSDRKNDKDSSHVIQSNLKQRTSRKSSEKSHKSKHTFDNDLKQCDPGAMTLDDLREPPKSEKQRYNQREKSKTRYSSVERKTKSKARKKLEDEFESSDSSLKENFPNGKKIKSDDSSSHKSKFSDSQEKRLKSKVEELFGLPTGVIDLKIPKHLQNSGHGISEEIQREKTQHLGQMPNGLLPLSDNDGRLSDGISIDGSNKSSGSQSSTILAVELLRKLYNVDTKTREELILKAKCFRRWLENVRSSALKGHGVSLENVNSTEHAQLIETANYGVCLQRAEIFNREHLLKRMLKKWRRRWISHAGERAAYTLHKQHTLRKGMNAFKWAISRSRIQIEILQSRARGALINATFIKWKTRAEANIKMRLEMSFARWRVFTSESQKKDLKFNVELSLVKRLRNALDKKLLHQSLYQWSCRFQMRLKENAADHYFRSCLLHQAVEYWKQFTTSSKEKKSKMEIAMKQHNKKLVKQTFKTVTVVYHKHRVAREHHRTGTLHQVLTAWLHVTQILKQERHRDMLVSIEHWTITTLQSSFTQWREHLLTQRAQKASHKKLVRNAWKIWKIQWETNVHERIEIEGKIRHDVLQETFETWKDNVARLKRRRHGAEVFIQRALVRQVIEAWHEHTSHRKMIRAFKRVFVHRMNEAVQVKYLSIWKKRFEDKLDLHRAKSFWSNTCARKAAVVWRTVCHHRLLDRLLVTSEPHRQLCLQKVMFDRWKEAKRKIDEEKHKADETRAILETSLLKQHFIKWKEAAEQRLKIRPMLMRREGSLLSETFLSWHGLVQHKSECRKNKVLCDRKKLRAAFGDWRKQYLIHQLEVKIKAKTSTNQLRRCIIGWSAVIKRKHSAVKFHNQQMVKQLFYCWRGKAFDQIKDKHETKETKELNMYLMREYFKLWHRNIHQQIPEREEAIQLMEQQRANFKVKSSFQSWRRLFRATIVARENQKLLVRRQLQKILTEWHDMTDFSVKDAIQKFAVQLGLQSPDGTPEGSVAIVDQLQNLTDFDHTDPLWSSFTSPALGTPRSRRMSSSRIAVDYDPDHKPSMADTSFLDNRFAIEHAVRTQRMREVVTMFIKRLRFWPLSNVFDQWKEFTARQREMKAATKQVKELHVQLQQKMVFRIWRETYEGSSKAKIQSNSSLQRRVFDAWYDFKCHSKYKKKLSALALHHNSMKIYRQIFPIWFEKAKEKRHTERIVHLWSTTTSEEQALLPVESSVKGRIQNKTLKKCFAIWSLKYQRITKLKNAYHRIVLERCLHIWFDWSSLKKEQREKCNEFNTRRLQTQMFRTWCMRQKQMTSVNRKHQESWEIYQSEILQVWHQWAKANKKRRVLAQIVTHIRQRNTLCRNFVVWREQTQKLQLASKLYNLKLVQKVVIGWHDVAHTKKQLKQKVLNFQVKSYTKLVIRMFKTWHGAYVDRLQKYEEHEQYVQRVALQMARTWRYKAQKARGQRLLQYHQQLEMKKYFERWRYNYERNLEREHQLKKLVDRKNWQLMGAYMDSWKTSLLAKQAIRLYNMKLTGTVLHYWHTFTQKSKRRLEVCAAYKEALSQRHVKSYFVYWVNMHRAQKSVEGHFHLKLQIQVLRSWRDYTRRQLHLKRLGAIMTCKVNKRMVSDVWMSMKCQFDYYNSLTETAEKIAEQKDIECVHSALHVWRERLNRVIARRCYHLLLARRGVRKWGQFVARKKMERKIDEEKMDKAVKHHNRKICSIAMEAWLDEMKVVHHIQYRKKKLLNKFGSLWKYRVDLIYTAKCVESENLMKSAWRRWRVEYAKTMPLTKIDNFETKHLKSTVFYAWKDWYLRKKRSKIAMKRSPSLNHLQMSRSSSSESFSARPSQIPMPVYRDNNQGNS